MGVERLVSLLEEQRDQLPLKQPDAYLVLMGDEAQRQGLVIAEKLRDQLPQLRLVTHCGGGSFKSQFKKADKSDAKMALILGEDELKKGVVGIKHLREEREQLEISLNELAVFLEAEI